MKLLLDADMLLYPLMAAAEVEVELAPDEWTRYCDLREPRIAYWDQIYAWCHEFNCSPDDVVHCFTDESAFRREIFPEYKANRKSKPKPIGFRAMQREIITSGATAYQFKMVEADDLMGMMATSPPFINDGFIILSGDKDMKQIPGFHAWLNTELYCIDNETADRHFWQQALIGDATDGIPGCPTVGEKTAEKIVQGFDLEDTLGCWQEVVSVYAKKGKVDGPEQYALTQARLVRILRHGDYNFQTHEVTLWNPLKN
jgi:DNA polymerase-1